MSHKGKGLSYEKPEPSFLRKLRNQYGEGSEHHRSRPNPRPTKAKYVEDEDDGPTYVDEESNEVISKDKYLEMVEGTNGETTAPDVGNAQPGAMNQRADEDGSGTGAPTSRPRQGVAEIGASKKRKQGKVVGGGDDALEAHNASQPPLSSDTAPRRKKNTKKKIKLSFDEE